MSSDAASMQEIGVFGFLLDFHSGAHTVSTVQILTDGFMVFHWFAPVRNSQSIISGFNSSLFSLLILHVFNVLYFTYVTCNVQPPT